MTDLGVYNAVYLGEFGNPFIGCKSLLSINVASGSSVYQSYNNVLYSKDGSTLLAYPSGRVGDFGVPYFVRVIGQFAFSGATGMTSISLPYNVSEIQAYAFEGCSRLSSIILPTALTRLDLEAFRSCTGLTSVTIPANTTTIGINPFTGCASLKNIFVEAGNPNYMSVDGVLFSISSNGFDLVVYPMAHGKDYAIPDGTGWITHRSFEGAELNSIYFPSSVFRIEAAAFGPSGSVQAIGSVYCEHSASEWSMVYIGEYNEVLTQSFFFFDIDAPHASVAEETAMTFSAPQSVVAPAATTATATAATLETAGNANFAITFDYNGISSGLNWQPSPTLPNQYEPYTNMDFSINFVPTAGYTMPQTVLVKIDGKQFQVRTDGTISSGTSNNPYFYIDSIGQYVLHIPASLLPYGTEYIAVVAQ